MKTTRIGNDYKVMLISIMNPESLVTRPSGLGRCWISGVQKSTMEIIISNVEDWTDWLNSIDVKTWSLSNLEPGSHYSVDVVPVPESKDMYVIEKSRLS